MEIYRILTLFFDKKKQTLIEQLSNEGSLTYEFIGIKNAYLTDKPNEDDCVISAFNFCLGE